MGMTDRQFISFRREQLQEFERLLAIASATGASEEIIDGLTKAVEKAREDIKA